MFSKYSNQDVYYMYSLIWPTMLYGSNFKVLGTLCIRGWLDFNWESTNNSPSTHYPMEIGNSHIILTKFGACPFWLEIVFHLFHFCIVFKSLLYTIASQDWYPYLAYCSLEFIALSCPHGCTKCWFTRVSNLLDSAYTSMDWLLPFKYSMDAPGHLLHTRQELKRILLDDIYRHYVGHFNKPSR